MKIVLRSRDGYYAGDRSDFEGPVVTTDLQCAQLFDITVNDGKLSIKPSLPSGDWQVCGVALSLDLSTP